MQFNFKLRRPASEAEEKRTDKEICLDWIKTAYAGNPGQTDTFTHLLWNAVLQKLEAAEADACELSPAEFLMVKLALIRANFTAPGNDLYCQLLEKVGIKL